MHKYKKIQKESEKLDHVVCDICLKKFDPEKDWMEIQEIHIIDFIAGYGSIFGDMNRVTADICQNCLKNLLGNYLKIEKVD